MEWVRCTFKSDDFGQTLTIDLLRDERRQTVDDHDFYGEWIDQEGDVLPMVLKADGEVEFGYHARTHANENDCHLSVKGRQITRGAFFDYRSPREEFEFKIVRVVNLITGKVD